MGDNDARTLLDEKISATSKAVAALWLAAALSLGIFLFLVSHDIVNKLLGTSAIACVVFGVLGAAKFGEWRALRRLKQDGPPAH